MLSSSKSNARAAELDGLVFGGGKDVFPGLYNQSPKAEYVYDQARDELDIFWCERARDEQIPALGICRGAQLMNVVCGGSLHQSVKEAYEDADYPDGVIHNTFYRKQIQIRQNSLLHSITGELGLHVNSIHKQAIDQIGQALSINAEEKNGVVQAISMDNHSFFLGVQFHPEFLIYRRVFRDIFKALVDAAGT